MRKSKNKNFYSNLTILIGITCAIGFFIIAEIIYFIISISKNGIFFTDQKPVPIPNLHPLIVGVSLLIIALPILIKYLKKSAILIIIALALIIVSALVASFSLGSTTRGQIGTPGTNLFTKWEKKTSIGFFKTDNTAPDVSLTAPVSTFCAFEFPRCGYVSGKMLISADITDNVSVEKVKIFLDDTLLKEFSSPPYSVLFNFGTVSKGAHNVKINAEDKARNTTNYSIQLTVD